MPKTLAYEAGEKVLESFHVYEIPKKEDTCRWKLLCHDRKCWDGGNNILGNLQMVKIQYRFILSWNVGKWYNYDDRAKGWEIHFDSI